MIKMIFYKNNHGEYIKENETDESLIFFVLIYDRSFLDLILEWLADDSQKKFYSDFFKYTKQNKNIIITELDFSDDDTEECSLEMKKYVFGELLKQWIEKVVIKKPSKVKVMVEKDSVKIETEK